MPELRAPENRRTGIEIKPKVRYPDQTEAAIVHPSIVLCQSVCRFVPTAQAEVLTARAQHTPHSSLDYSVLFDALELRG
jgi:hypothetical protein